MGRLTAALQLVLVRLIMSMVPSDPSTWPEFRSCENIMDWYDEVVFSAGCTEGGGRRFKRGDMKVTEIRRYKDFSVSQHEYLIAKVVRKAGSAIYIKVERTKDPSVLVDGSNQDLGSNSEDSAIAATVAQNPDSTLSAFPNPTRLSTENSVHAHVVNGRSNSNVEDSVIITTTTAPQDLSLGSATSPDTTSGGLGFNIESHVDAATAIAPPTLQGIHSSASPSSSAAAAPQKVAARGAVSTASIVSTGSVASSDSISISSRVYLTEPRPPLDIIQLVSSWPDEGTTQEIERGAFRKTSFYDLVVASATLYKSSPDYTLFKEQCYWFASVVLLLLVKCDPTATYMYVPGQVTKPNDYEINKMILKENPEDGAEGAWYGFPIPHGTNYIDKMREQFKETKSAFCDRIMFAIKIEEDSQKYRARGPKAVAEDCKDKRRRAEIMAETRRAEDESRRATRVKAEIERMKAKEAAKARKAEAAKAGRARKADEEAAEARRVAETERTSSLAAELQEKEETNKRLRALLAQRGITDV